MRAIIGIEIQRDEVLERVETPIDCGCEVRHPQDAAFCSHCGSRRGRVKVEWRVLPTFKDSVQLSKSYHGVMVRSFCYMDAAEGYSSQFLPEKMIFGEEPDEGAYTSEQIGQQIEVVREILCGHDHGDLTPRVRLHFIAC